MRSIKGGSINIRKTAFGIIITIFLLSLTANGAPWDGNSRRGFGGGINDDPILVHLDCTWISPRNIV